MDINKKTIAEEYIEERANYHFDKALSESETIGELQKYKDEELLNRWAPESNPEDDIKKSISGRFDNKVREYIKNKKIDEK